MSEGMDRVAELLEAQEQRRQHDERRVQPFVIEGAIIRVGSGFTATAALAGQRFRGNPKTTRAAALADLFMQLTQGTNQDAALALDMASTGEHLEDVNEDIREALAALESDGGASRGRRAIGGYTNAGGDQVAL